MTYLSILKQNILNLWSDVVYKLQLDKEFKVLFEVKTSLGALRKTFVGIELDWPVMLGSVTLVRVKSARVTAIWISYCYMR